MQRLVSISAKNRYQVQGRSVHGCSLPAKSGSNEGRVAKHGSRAQESAQAEWGGQGWSGAVVGRWGQAREGSSRSCSSCPGGLEGRVGVMREGPSLQVVAERVARCQGAWERQARRVGLHPGLLALPPLGPAVLKPHLRADRSDDTLIYGSLISFS